MEDCIALKRRVHDFIKAGALAFDNEGIPDVNRNPLLDHQRPKVNAVENDPELLVEKDARAVRMSMGMVYDVLLKVGMLEEEQEKKEEKEDQKMEHCLYDKGFVGHSIQVCQDFLELVQEMMNEGVMVFCKEIKRQVVNVLQGKILKSIIIYYQGGGQQAPAKAPIHPIPKVVIKVLAPFQYSSDKAISWNYTNQVTSQEPQAIRVSPEMKQESSVNDIVGTGELTRSGRCYAQGLQE